MAFKRHAATEMRPHKQFPKRLYKIFVKRSSSWTPWSWTCSARTTTWRPSWSSTSPPASSTSPSTSSSTGFRPGWRQTFFQQVFSLFFRGRAVPPRLFCDICDEFDLHDTEDCPTQVWHNTKVLSCCFSLSFHFKIFHTWKQSHIGIIQKCYFVVFLFLPISKFSTQENMKTNSQASSTVVEEEKSHTKKNSKRGLVI